MLGSQNNNHTNHQIQCTEDAVIPVRQIASRENMMEFSSTHTGEDSLHNDGTDTENAVPYDTHRFDISSIVQISTHLQKAQSHLNGEIDHTRKNSTWKVQTAHFTTLSTVSELHAVQNFEKTLSNLKQEMDHTAPMQNESEYEDLLSSEVAKAEEYNVGMIARPVYYAEINPSEEKVITSTDTETNNGNNYINIKGDFTDKRQSADKNNVNRTIYSFDSPTTATQSDREGFKPVKEAYYSFDCEESFKMISKQDDKFSTEKMLKSSTLSVNHNTTHVIAEYHERLSEKGAPLDRPDSVNFKKYQIKILLYEAACQQSIILQASQALNIAELSSDDSSSAVIEGERLLLLATERRNMCLEEVTLLKGNVIGSYSPKATNIPPPCNATLTLSDIKLPLHHQFMNSLQTSKSDVGVFHFVLIASVGYKNVHSTQVVSCYGNMEDSALSMANNILLKNVPHDFTLSVRVFAMHTKKINNKVRKLKEKIINSNFKNLFPKRNKAGEYSYYASPQTVFRKSNFKLVGENKLTLNSIGNGLTKYALKNVQSKCSIEGLLQMRISCTPEYNTNARGFLTLQEDVGRYTAWNRRWCKMEGNDILYWRYPEDERYHEAMGSIDLQHCGDGFVKLLPHDVCARPHTFEVTLTREKLPSDKCNFITTIRGEVTKTKHWICCDNKEDRIHWVAIVNKQLSDSLVWGKRSSTSL